MLPGIYIKVEKKSNTDVSVIVPYSDQFGFSCTQKWFRPVEEMFNAAKGIIQSSLSNAGGAGNLAVGATEIFAQGFRLFGVQLFNKAFMAKAWEGTEPIDLGINLKFFFGMKDLWSAKEEVYKPIMKLMGYVVPEGEGIIITTPGPSAIDVFGFYASDIFRGIKASLTRDQLNNTVQQQLGENIDNTSVPIGNRNRNSINKTWKITVGYSSNGTSINTPFFVLDNLIVTSSSFTLSPEVDTDGAPINGTVKMNLTSQTLILQSDFTEQTMYTR